ncbi:uroporphyrinogen-III synthase [Vibrio sp. SM6]|uniref:Uroporphyrinogen-III synthase n=1 Tax=Vibrio agarilyticus TaxID=2726741 RepID=A0A7X8YHE9_9VIBR|nr:uroporphyrinogen-III synthase [Vibrio agarilyticus]NLS13659.1 uroporphyrinogen-III synthase [Vibrio agarilyticus]
MKVLVTRPNGEGQALCHELAAHGIAASHQPLLDIITAPSANRTPPLWPHVDVIIAVSQHAVYHADAILKKNAFSWPSQAHYLAVGQKTAHYLSKASQQHVHFPEISDSEHLLQLPELGDLTNQQVVIMRGNGGRELIYDTLQQRGAFVTYWETYQRQWHQFDAAAALKQWQQDGINALIITSAEQLHYFVTQCAPYGLAAVCQWQLWVPSERIAMLARQHGFTHVVAVGSASNSAFINALISRL